MVRPQTYRVVSRFLAARGWRRIRTRGSHEIWESPDGRAKVTVVAHEGIVSAGVVRQIQAHFPDDTEAAGWR
ncbi:type II toxin-antitoxin system HicA family toxin [Acidipropionibacterium virtanenii]|uniref:type II toxin-antitoxin system HicA family toxin n=1 Tax=Acidipropionibacterium virtanenii TaxID=2057246 RepID=UPI000DEC6FE0